MRSISLTGILWYICGMATVSALVTSLITFLPERQWVGDVLYMVFVSMAVATAAVAWFLGRLPATHRIHQSAPLKASLLVIATVLTVLLVMVI